MNRIALITGATSGIGLATATAFANKNICLIICGRNQQSLEKLTQELSQKTKVISLNFDVSKNAEVIAAIDSLSDDWKKIDILVNCAGNAHGLSSIENGDIEDWDKMMDANVKGTAIA